MNKKWILIALVFVAVAAVAGLYFLMGDRSSSELSPEAKLAVSDAALQMEGLEYVQTRDGKKEWILTAQSAHFLKDRNEAELEDVKITFYPKNGGEVVMTSENGRFNTSTQDIQAWGNVHVKSQDGYSFQAPSVSYLAQSRQITTDEDVRFAGPQFQVEGRGLLVELESGKLNILNQVSATIWGDVWENAQKS